ncbi:MAG TPA: folylpolyglutamate synthase/dihydrofolate synthase family protein [Nitrospirota bacterium]|nr:folylpolyglutamate synthase/dihydrofolate synthase family protein [Nitrospirota bacterium]
MSQDSSYQNTIDYLFGLQKHGIKLALANSHTLMQVMGDPHKKFRSVHIAGTNGKGSTSAFLADVLRAAGYRVGLYTSPHLVSFTERIRIDNVQISEQKVVALAQRVRDGYRGVPAADGAGALTPTFFEVTTAMAFTWFAEESVDIAVIEVGMGGRMDSTNVITPLVSVITNIDLEHTEFLGDTLESIAREKAGIIKPGVPVITGVAQPKVIEVIEREAASKRTPVYRLTKDFLLKNVRHDRTQVFDYQGMRASYNNVRITMHGRYQVDNASLAIAAAECMEVSGIILSEPALRLGLERAQWEGRLERVGRRPDIYLDGAHNPASAKMLAGAVQEMKSAYRRLVLIIGILGDKDYRGILAELVPLAERVIVTRPQYSRAMDVQALASEVQRLHSAVVTAETVGDAIAMARQTAGADDLILVTGSLYVVGEARSVLVREAGRSQQLSGLKG